MTGQFWDITSDDNFQRFQEDRAYRKLAGKRVVVQFAEPEKPPSSPTQFRSMHRWFRLVADYLNQAGLDQRVVLKPDAEIPWSEEAVKEQLWRKLQIAMTGKESTKEIDSQQSCDIHEALCRHLGEKLGCTLPEWPHEDRL